MLQGEHLKSFTVLRTKIAPLVRSPDPPLSILYIWIQLLVLLLKVSKCVSDLGLISFLRNFNHLNFNRLMWPPSGLFKCLEESQVVKVPAKEEKLSVKESYTYKLLTKNFSAITVMSDCSTVNLT